MNKVNKNKKLERKGKDAIGKENGRGRGYRGTQQNDVVLMR